MKKINIFTVACCCLFSSFTACGSPEKVPVEQVTRSWDEVVRYAKENLPQEGILVMKPNGFGYIRVDDKYIHTLFPMLGLEGEGYKEPPYFRSPNAVGVHISVFYVDEHIVPEEVGQVFHFELKNIEIVQPTKTTSYAVLQVNAPELEKLREKYGLEPKLHGHEFHISLAKKTVPKKSSHHKQKGSHHKHR